MIYVFLAEGFEEIEALAPVDFLRRAGLEVRTVGVTGKTVKSSHGIPVAADLIPEETEKDGIEAVILPGGMPGTLNLEKSDFVQGMIDCAAENGKYVCAICAAPSVLGHKGLLKGREATAYPGFEKDLEGAVISEKYVVRDGNFITARGAGVSFKFAREIASVFVGREKADKIYSAIQCES